MKLFFSWESANRYAQQQEMDTGYQHTSEHIVYGWHVEKSYDLIETGISTFEYQMRDNSFRLINAFSEGDFEAADRLIKEPLEIHYLDSRGVSLLMVAAYRGYHEYCEELISLGADVLHGYSIFDNELNELDSDSVINRARISKKWPTIDLIERARVLAKWKLLKNSQDPSRFEDAHQWLIEAAGLGMTATCVEMVEMGVPIDGAEDFPPVRQAAFSDEMTTCLVLLVMGADIDPLRREPGFNDEVISSLENVRNFFSSWKPSNNF